SAPGSMLNTRACFSPHVPTPHTPTRTGFIVRSAREPAHRGLGEAREMLDLRVAAELRAEPRDRSLDRQALAEQDPVGAVERLERRGREPAALEPDLVDPGHARRAARHAHEGRDVLRDAR